MNTAGSLVTPLTSYNLMRCKKNLMKFRDRPKDQPRIIRIAEIPIQYRAKSRTNVLRVTRLFIPDEICKFSIRKSVAQI